MAKEKRILVYGFCKNCHVSFGARRHYVARGMGLYCSRQCHYAFKRKQKCNVLNCDGKYFGLGHCRKHYRQLETVKQQTRAMAALSRKKNPEKFRAYARVHYYAAKEQALRHYSQGSIKCNSCGITDIRVLDLDHINNDGNKHRKTVSGRNKSISIYMWLRKYGYPSGYQVLCRNCNFLKYLEYREFLKRAG